MSILITFIIIITDYPRYPVTISKNQILADMKILGHER